MRVTVKGVKPGSYKARLASVETKSGDYGVSVLYKFTIVGSAHDGEEIARFTPIPTAGNIGAKFAAGILGKPVNVGEEIDFGPFIGSDYHINVAPTKSGSVRVESCILVDANGGAA